MWQMNQMDTEWLLKLDLILGTLVRKIYLICLCLQCISIRKKRKQLWNEYMTYFKEWNLYIACTYTCRGFFNIKQIFRNKFVPFRLDNNQISYMVWCWPMSYYELYMVSKIHTKYVNKSFYSKFWFWYILLKNDVIVLKGCILFYFGLRIYIFLTWLFP